MLDPTKPHAQQHDTGAVVHDVIDSPHHPVARRVKDVLRSRSAKPRTVVIDDLENIEQALRSGIRLDSLYLTEGLPPESLADAAVGCRGLPTFTLSRAVAGDLFGEEKRTRVFALAHAPRPTALADLSRRAGDIVVLDGVRLMGNIGAITRTVMALGAAGLVLLESGLRTVLDRRLIRASRGLVFSVPLVLATRGEFARYAAHGRLTLATLTAEADEPLHSIQEVPGRVAVILGSERHGVSAELDALAAHRYAIAMSPEVESLNVSVSAAIALYERSRV
ncbi:TrmH family RNA methyltransferase [Goodfellowiella coeruleoviolacea]|uniref:RNA methyltransferase, TrmH family n=1 Tax=Goodfellowiella coeruleoviolacea TaxID=334858 RepID=A0AAE3KIG9_9PSEU|nr:TrmH family RNA methyltransferase [Goodfellowiella coeruleoviolacea]MCP2169251.1 RNA methyltransferase, TrmH family [Goodfellowiella coeruleoviolacea]